jgi:hypothetical protein
MKRTGSTGYQGPKRAKSGDDDEPTFEDTLMDMDEDVNEERIDGEDTEETRKSRWSRIDVANDFNPLTNALGNY